MDDLAKICGTCGAPYGAHFPGQNNACPNPGLVGKRASWTEHVKAGVPGTSFSPGPDWEPLPLRTEGARVVVSTVWLSAAEPDIARPYEVAVVRRAGPGAPWEWDSAITQRVALEREARDLHRRAVEELKQHPELFE